MVRNYYSLDDTASQDVIVPATQDESGTQVESTEDILLTLQRATSAIGMIYNDFLINQKLISWLLCLITVLLTSYDMYVI